jgi:pyruvate,water dikinase
LEDIRHASPEADAALQAYLDDRGWRVVTQYSPRGLTLHELPNVVVAAVLAAADDPQGERQANVADAGAVRAKVPTAEQARFDALLAEARAGYGTRDDNVTLTFLWPSGLLRRAMLEVGRRLAERGTIEAIGHVMTLELDEMKAALAAAADEQATWRGLAAARQASMDAADAASAPLVLGPAVAPPPDFSLLPPAMADVTAAVMSMLMLETAHDGAAAWTGAGTGIGAHPFVGRACVATDPEEALARLEPGDVLVTTHTTPAYEAILPIVGAVVTDHGGLTSHAALVSRELGLPAVLGVVGATTTIPDGAMVTVDPIAGRVTIADQRR